MAKKRNQNNAALYLRLSRSDGDDVESNSIGNQRAILQKHAAESGLNVVGEYVDDGLSGTTFARPSFMRMIDDINAGTVGAVLCKDLSRLGRNNALVAYYTEIFFVENHVRFICVIDGIDTAIRESEIMPFMSIINEYFAKDLSKKVRSAYRSQALKGNYTGQTPPFGYMKSPENKHLLIHNPETAPYVQKMFRMAAEGKGAAHIARIMRKEGILTPRSYAQKKWGITKPKTYKDETDWADTSVRVILTNKVYLGHMISQKSRPTSFKNRKPVKLPEEDYIVVLNTHEPLVTKEEFDIAQASIRKKQRRNKHDFVNIFSGLLKCSDCGAGLVLHTPVRKGVVHKSYICNRYRQRSKYCTSHYIKYEDVYKLVLESIQEKQRFVKEHRNELADYARKLAGNDANSELKRVRGRLENAKTRRDELDVLIQKLFEQVAMGSLSQERFDSLCVTYENEQKELKEKIAALEISVSTQNDEDENTSRFVELIKRHGEVTELTIPVLHEFIGSVIVHQAEGGKIHNRKQKVIINFRFN
jgi:DNA invertase Pin-like site-specific DNA recombinase/transcription elongation factor Elf1